MVGWPVVVGHIDRLHDSMEIEVVGGRAVPSGVGSYRRVAASGRTMAAIRTTRVFVTGPLRRRRYR